ncbi:GbsR/MarR family transcriptional regulator [Streptosporangium saharense]|uniref:GbsR/MarR family transcriptional regulator n=1 Tax=Streptosporangium saharense TaxID=1706840 RepID=UPI00332DB2FB
MDDTASALTEPAEHLALVLTAGGLQRMTARVLAALIFSELPSLTMGELSESLGASAGTVSDAVKALGAVGLVERVPAPGSRRGHYRLPTGAWAALHSQQNAMVAAMLQAAEEGLAQSEPGGHAERRLREMRDFHGFLIRELPRLMERWHSERNASAETAGTMEREHHVPPSDE